MSEITVIGEALVDVVESESGIIRTTPGGSPLNVAVGLARLGISVELVSEIGADDHGALIRRHLADSGVGTADILEVAATSSAIAAIRADGAADYRFSIDWHLSGLTPRADANAIHVGSIGAWMEPGSARVAELITGTESAIVSFDPNVRPRLVRDRQAVLDRIDALIEVADVVKLSDEDADWIFPGRPPESVADLLIDRGVSLAAVTLGAAGCLLRTPHGGVERTSDATTVADTIGAGDAFMSGLLAALISASSLDRLRSGIPDAELAALAAVASASAAIVVARPGADPPRAQELPLDQLARFRQPRRVIAEFRSLPGREREVSALIAAYAEVVRAERGTLEFAVHRESGPRGGYVVTESYRDENAFRDHLNDPAGLSFNSKLAPLIESGVSKVRLIDIVA